MWKVFLISNSELLSETYIGLTVRESREWRNECTEEQEVVESEAINCCKELNILNQSLHFWKTEIRKIEIAYGYLHKLKDVICQRGKW